MMRPLPPRHRAHPLPRRPAGRERGRSSSTGSPASSRTLIQAEGPETIAAFFAEPVQGAGGVHRPAARLFRADPGDPQAARHPVRGRRGDLRLRPHRQHVGLRHLRHPARPAHLRQAALLGLPADRGAADERRLLPGAGRPEREAGHARHGLHLWRPPGLGGGGAGDAAGSTRRTASSSTCARSCAALPAPPEAAGARTRWSARRAASG